MSLTFEEGESLLEDRNYRELSRRARSIDRMSPDEKEACRRLRRMLKDYRPDRPPVLRGPSPAQYPLDIVSYPVRFLCYWWGPVMDHMQAEIDLDVGPPKRRDDGIASF